MDSDWTAVTARAAATSGDVLASSNGTVEIPEGVALFDCVFARDGADLVLSAANMVVARIEGYFVNGAPDLVAANGAVLPGAQVVTLAGARADMLIAQDGGFGAPQPIGQVVDISGRAEVQRADGSVVELQLGDSIYQNDVLITTVSSTISVTFVDGTIFSLAENSRMIIDELIYDPGGDDNSGVFNLVQGGFVFIAGQVAKTGDMDVNTPSATMGIRGTTVTVEIEVVNGEAVVRVALNPDPDGTIGSIELTDLNGQVISLVTDPNTQWFVSPSGAEQQERTAEQLAEDQRLISLVSSAFQAAQSATQSGGNDGDGDGGSQGGGGGEAGEEAPEDGGEDGGEDQPAEDGDAGEGQEQQGDQEASGDDQAALTPPPAQGDGLGLGAGPAGGADQQGGGGGGVINGQPFTSVRVVVVVNDQSPIEAQTIQTEFAEDSAGATVALDATGAEGAQVVYRLIDATLPDPETEATITNFDANAGTFDLVPAPDFFGELTIAFRASASDGRSDDGLVRVIVTPVDDAPTLAQTQFAGVEDTDAVLDLEIRDIDNDPAIYDLRLGGAASAGQASLSEEGILTITPDPDQSGLTTVEVQIVDGDTVLSSALVEVTFVQAPDAPTLEAATLLASEDGTPVTLDLTQLGQDADPEDDGSTLSYEVVSAPVEGAISIAGGVLTFDPEEGFQDLDAGQIREVSFDIRATDSTGLSTVTRMIARVTGAEDAPVPGGADTLALTATEDDLLQQFDLLGAARDVDGDDLDIAIVSVVSETGALVGHGLQDGVLSIDPTQFDGLAEGAQTIVTVTYTVTDGDSTPVQGMTTLTVAGINDAPIPAEPEVLAQTVTETGPAVIFDLVGSASDIEGDDLTASVTSVQGQSGTDIAFTFENGQLSIDRAQFDGLQSGARSDVVILYSVSDGTAPPVVGTTYLTVLGEADGPRISAAGPTGFVEAETAQAQSLQSTGVISLTDPDIGETLSVTSASNGDISWSGGTLDAKLAAELVAGFTAQAVGVEAGDVAWTYATAPLDLDFLNAGDVISWSYTLTVIDSTGGGADTQLTFTLTGSADGPTVSGDLTGHVTEDAAVSTKGKLILSDPDAQAAGFVEESGFAGKYGTVDVAADGTWVYTLNNDLDAVQALNDGDMLHDVVTLSTTDGTEHDLSITIQGQDEPPVFGPWQISGAKGSVAEGTSVTLTSTGRGEISVEEADAFLGLSSGTLANAIGDTVFPGTVAKTELTVDPGSILEFSFTLTGQDVNSVGFPDTAFVVINGDVTILSAQTQSVSVDDLTRFSLTEGTYEIGFGVFDVNDNIFAATLAVSDLAIVAADLGDGDMVDLTAFVTSDTTDTAQGSNESPTVADLVQPDPIFAEGAETAPSSFAGQAALLDMLAQDADAVVTVPSA